MTDFAFPMYDVESMDQHKLTGDICPVCGDALESDEEVVNWDTEEEGKVLELAPDTVEKPLLHPHCYREKRGIGKQSSLDDTEQTGVDNFLE